MILADLPGKCKCVRKLSEITLNNMNKIFHLVLVYNIINLSISYSKLRSESIVQRNGE